MSQELERDFTTKETSTGIVITGMTDSLRARVQLGGELTIPSSLRGRPVVRIGEKAFRNLSTVENVVIPEGIVSIGRSAFKGSASLKRVSLPSTLKDIEYRAFKECSGLASLELPDSL